MQALQEQPGLERPRPSQQQAAAQALRQAAAWALLRAATPALLLAAAGALLRAALRAQPQVMQWRSGRMLQGVRQLRGWGPMLRGFGLLQGFRLLQLWARALLVRMQPARQRSLARTAHGPRNSHSVLGRMRTCEA